MYETLAIIAAFAFVYSAVGGGLERTPFSGALVFTAFGLVFGPLGLNLLKLDVDAEGLRTLAELTLALVLFSDAANSNLGVIKEKIRLPRRLLLVGLPLTILLGYVVPQFTELFEGVGQVLPLPTRITIAVGEGLQHYGWIVVLLVAGAAWLVRHQLSQPQSRYQWQRSAAGKGRGNYPQGIEGKTGGKEETAGGSGTG